MIIMLSYEVEFSKKVRTSGREEESEILDTCAQGGRWGVKMGKNLRTSLMDGPLLFLYGHVYEKVV